MNKYFEDENIRTVRNYLLNEVEEIVFSDLKLIIIAQDEQDKNLYHAQFSESVIYSVLCVNGLCQLIVY